MTSSTYFVYELLPGEGKKYKFLGTIKVDDGEKAKDKAVQTFYPNVPVFWRPHVRVSTCPLGEHAKNYLPNFFPKH